MENDGNDGVTQGENSIGRHILSRQITNSRCVLPKAEITEEDDVKENEEGKKIRRNISI